MTVSQTIIVPGTVMASMLVQKNNTGLQKLQATGGDWLLCNGAEVSKDEYPELFEALGTFYGGQATPNFNLPNLEGQFLRGVDPTGKIDPNKGTRTAAAPGDPADELVGSTQQDGFKSHSHSPPEGRAWGSFNAYTEAGESGSNVAVPQQRTDNTADTGGAETRPKNVYVYWFIFAGISSG